MLKKLKLQRWLLALTLGLFLWSGFSVNAQQVNRNITGSTVTAITTTYMAGTSNAVLSFQTSILSNDAEWVGDLELDLPAGVSVVSATIMQDDMNWLNWDGQTGNGVLTSWTAPAYGNFLKNGDVAPFTVTVNIDPAFAGNMNIAWSIIGEVFGAAPHTITGTATLAQQIAEPGIELLTSDLALGNRPIGAWRKSGKFEIVNNPGKGDATITASEIDDNTGFLVLQNPALPYILAEGETMEIGLTSTAAATNGQSFAGTYGLVYNDGDRSLITATYSALAYTPVAGNVWENPYTGVNVNAPYGSGTNSALGMYNVYELPDAAPADGRNIVYKFVIPTDRMFHLSPLTTAGAKWALYADGFEGVGGPDVDNSVVHGTGVLSNFPLYAGTYYLVFSTTGNDYNIYFDVSPLMPAPVAATYVAPADGAVNINNGMSLSWTFGNFTDEYQLVLGTTYPPSTIVVPFTSNLATSYVLTGLQPNLQYFWQVNSRNTSGTTAGPVWGFTTTIDVPAGLTASVVDLGPTVPTVAVNLSWTADNSRAFLGYNVYRNGVKLNTAILTGTTYADLGLARNTTYTYGVTAVYDEGESAPATLAVTTKGVGVVTGTVTDELTTTPLAGATVVVVGNQGTYNLTTAANGTYSAQVYAGTYGFAVSADGFISENISGVVVAHAATVTTNFQLLEVAYPVDFVIASEISDDQVLLEWGFDIESFVPQQYPFNTNGMSAEEIAKNWRAFLAMNNITASGNATDSRSLVEYQIYREKAYQPGTEELIGTTIQNQFVDFDWGLQDWGVYNWNVRVVYTNQVSAPVSSNTLDKDMLTTVSVAVVTNSGDSPAGTSVSFTNISEPSLELDFSTVLGSNGTFSWDAFRKGTYNIEVARAGFATITENNVDIFDASEFNWLLIEILAVPTDLYVTPTGLATWSAGNAIHGGFENYTSDLESDNGGWVSGAISGTDQWQWGVPAQYNINRAFSGTKVWMTGLTANYTANSNMWIMREFDFTDAVSPMISVQLYILTENNWDGMIVESSLDGGTTWSYVDAAGLYNGLPYPYGPLQNLAKWTGGTADYQYFEGSLASLAGQSSVWLRFRFASDVSGQLEGIAIDNISVTDMPAPVKSRELLSFKVFNDGVLVAEVAEPTYQYGTNGEVLVDGQTYLAEVATVYTTGQSDKASYTWTYIACDNYAAPENFTATQVEGTVNVAISWTMPVDRVMDAVDFARITRDGEVIAEVEGTSYLDEDLDFATYTYCITFVYESGAETCPATVCETVEVVGGGMVNGNVKEAAY
ncbi:MAG: hypothetical protein HGA37_01300, partial [Lentimicrobium sp.]|nr:hypothetical protein [Lentimicrobium sp.]